MARMATINARRRRKRKRENAYPAIPASVVTSTEAIVA